MRVKDSTCRKTSQIIYGLLQHVGMAFDTALFSSADPVRNNSAQRSSWPPSNMFKSNSEHTRPLCLPVFQPGTLRPLPSAIHISFRHRVQPSFSRKPWFSEPQGCPSSVNHHFFLESVPVTLLRQLRFMRDWVPTMCRHGASTSRKSANDPNNAKGNSN